MRTLLRFLTLTMCLALLFPMAVFAGQFDASYNDLLEKNKDKWAAEDKQINAKLAALEKKFGKKPNIIYVLADDVGWGEMGWQGGGKHRGTPTPELDKMALEGMRFWTAYAEPSCTPSRIAINTGRHPVRTGLLSVLWPGQIDGLSGKEVTVAEVLSEAGYSTAMWASGISAKSPSIYRRARVTIMHTMACGTEPRTTGPVHTICIGTDRVPTRLCFTTSLEKRSI